MANLKASGHQPRVHATDKYHRCRLIEPNYDKYHYIIKRGNNHIDYIVQLKK